MKTKVFENEMAGFVVYEPEATAEFLLFSKVRPALSCKGMVCKLNPAAKIALGGPAYVNLFIDESGKRVMVRAAGESTENAVPISGHYSQRKSGGDLQDKGFAERVKALVGKEAFIAKGRVVGERKDAVIFELAGALDYKYERRDNLRGLEAAAERRRKAKKMQNAECGIQNSGAGEMQNAECGIEGGEA